MTKAWSTVLVGVSGNLLAALFCLPLLSVPDGSGIKPMTLPCVFILIAAGPGSLGSQSASDASRPDGSKLLLFVGMCLCLTPLFVGVFRMHMFAAMRSLTFR